MPDAKTDISGAILTELVLVKRLLLLLLAKLGSDSDEIGMALGIPARTVRNWILFREVRKIPTGGKK